MRKLAIVDEGDDHVYKWQKFFGSVVPTEEACVDQRRLEGSVEISRNATYGFLWSLKQVSNVTHTLRGCEVATIICRAMKHCQKSLNANLSMGVVKFRAPIDEAAMVLQVVYTLART